MPVYVWGAVGALAPEVVRWFRIAREGPPGEWKRVTYWLATVAYAALGAALAYLIGKGEPYAAFSTGVSTELAILGLLNPKPDGPRSEEISQRPAGLLDPVLIPLRHHARYLSLGRVSNSR